MLGLDRVAHTLVPMAGVALSDEPRHFILASRRDHVIGTVGAQPACRGEAAVEVLEIGHVGQGGGLVDDRLGPGGRYCCVHRCGIQDIHNDTIRT